jgi:hypothetical protein
MAPLVQYSLPIPLTNLPFRFIDGNQPVPAPLLYRHTQGLAKQPKEPADQEAAAETECSHR